ncbi:MAG TPA: enolase C-terminal domain-like protein [bacterium]|nr:enolase C-terminal domain-like protein [bacterium]
MKITDVAIDLVNITYTHMMSSATSKASGTSKCIVRLHTDDGIIGLGEAPGGAETQEEILRAHEALRGQDPFRIEAIVERLPGPHRGLYGPTPTAVSALEMAVWDIMGKAVGRPVCDLLGGRYRDAVPVCAPLFTHEDAEGDFASATVAAAEEAIARWGFGTVKVKAGVYRPGAELGALRALRRKFGDDLALRVDPNGVWSPEDSIRFGQRALDLDLEWMEDPTWGIEGMRRVRAAVPVPLATNMCVRNFDEVPVAFRTDAVDVILGDHRIWGGIWPTRKLAALCEGMNLGFGLHSSHELGIATAARLHLAAATAHLSYPIDVTHWFHADDVVAGGPPRIAAGKIAVPTGPGLGIELDPEAVERGVTRYRRDGPYVTTFTNPSRYWWWV